MDLAIKVGKQIGTFTILAVVSYLLYLAMPITLP